MFGLQPHSNIPKLIYSRTKELNICFILLIFLQFHLRYFRQKTQLIDLQPRLVIFRSECTFGLEFLAIFPMTRYSKLPRGRLSLLKIHRLTLVGPFEVRTAYDGISLKKWVILLLLLL